MYKVKYFKLSERMSALTAIKHANAKLPAGATFVMDELGMYDECAGFQFATEAY
jgi:hypothetical protein